MTVNPGIWTHRIIPPGSATAALKPLVVAEVW